MQSVYLNTKPKKRNHSSVKKLKNNSEIATKSKFKKIIFRNRNKVKTHVQLEIAIKSKHKYNSKSQ